MNLLHCFKQNKSINVGLKTVYIIIFFIGIVLIAVEILFIPGFGIAGIPGIILILIGAILSFQDFTIPRTPYDVDMFVNELIEAAQKGMNPDS